MVLNVVINVVLNVVQTCVCGGGGGKRGNVETWFKRDVFNVPQPCNFLSKDGSTGRPSSGGEMRLSRGPLAAKYRKLTL